MWRPTLTKGQKWGESEGLGYSGRSRLREVFSVPWSENLNSQRERISIPSTQKLISTKTMMGRRESPHSSLLLTCLNQQGKVETADARRELENQTSNLEIASPDLLQKWSQSPDST